LTIREAVKTVPRAFGVVLGAFEGFAQTLEVWSWTLEIFTQKAVLKAWRGCLRDVF